MGDTKIYVRFELLSSNSLQCVLAKCLPIYMQSNQFGILEKIDYSFPIGSRIKQQFEVRHLVCFLFNLKVEHVTIYSVVISTMNR